MSTSKRDQERAETADDEPSSSTSRVASKPKEDPFADPRRGQDRRQRQAKGDFKRRKHERRKPGYAQGGAWWLSRNYVRSR